MVNAQRFRARKVDLKRPLPVHRAAELDDLDDDDNRQVDAIETGVEKDEETEHHLQAAISATHAAATGNAPAKQVYIPTPDASKVVSGYDALYPASFTSPSSLIRSSETVEECCAPQYCLDDDDLEWLHTHQPGLTEDEFEHAMDQLEQLTRDMVFQRPDDIPTLDHLVAYAADRDRPFARTLVELVFPHWRARRVSRGFKPVMAALQQEDTLKTEIDPYVCFRRREVRQGRKTRRADQRSLEQMRRMRISLATATQLLELCVEREAAKMQLASEAQAVSARRAMVLRMRRKLGVTGQCDDLFVPPVQRKKATRDPRPRVRKARVPDADPMQPFALPTAVTVHPHPATHNLAERIHTATRAFEARLANGWVDATFGQLASSEPTRLFWAPDATTALRMRRGRLGRLFLDRRAVHVHTTCDSRLEKYRLGLLRPEDRLRQTAVHDALVPGELLRPFSFGGLPSPTEPPAAAPPQQLPSQVVSPLFESTQTASPPLSASSAPLAKPRKLDPAVPSGSPIVLAMPLNVPALVGAVSTPPQLAAHGSPVVASNTTAAKCN
ncbi:enhancer of polycomb-like-domain-containing protein [Coemansia spiralis]|nr:enhancer of polycomb-like-domain-containing protein [Coemansia spiralis]